MRTILTDRTKALAGWSRKIEPNTTSWTASTQTHFKSRKQRRALARWSYNSRALLKFEPCFWQWGKLALYNEYVLENKTPEASFANRGRLGKAKQNQYQKTKSRLLAAGFLPFNCVPRLVRRIVTDPLYMDLPAKQFHITGTNAGRKGGTKFSCFDFFGVRMLHESYYVVDWERFSEFISARLELMFRAKNPNQPRHLRTAFTRLIHDFGLHWSGCQHFVGSEVKICVSAQSVFENSTVATWITKPLASS